MCAYVYKSFSFISIFLTREQKFLGVGEKKIVPLYLLSTVHFTGLQNSHKLQIFFSSFVPSCVVITRKDRTAVVSDPTRTLYIITIIYVHIVQCVCI